MTTVKHCDLYLPPTFQKTEASCTPTPGQRIKHYRHVQYLQDQQPSNAFYMGTCRYQMYKWTSFFPGHLHSTKEIIFALRHLSTLGEFLRQHPPDTINCIFGDLLSKAVRPTTQAFLALPFAETQRTITKLVIEVSSRKVYYTTDTNDRTPYNVYYTDRNNQALNMAVHELTDAEIEQDLHTIRQLSHRLFPQCQTIFIVGHVNLKLRATGTYIKKRNELCRVLQAWTATSKDMTFCDVGEYLSQQQELHHPTPQLRLEDVLPDSCHWNKKGRSKVKHFLDHCLAYHQCVMVVLFLFLVLGGLQPTEAAVAMATASTSPECSVTAFGARCDGRTDDTRSIQAALAACTTRQQQTTIPAHQTCLSQPLVLYNNTRLHLLNNATLKAGQRWNDTAFISASHADNIFLTAAQGGTIDGSGKQWWTGSNTTPGRPPLLVLTLCNHVWIEGVTIINPAAWTTALSGTDYHIYHVTIKSPPYSIAPNTDGIDLAVDGAHVKGCVVENGDDSICMKSPCHNVLVEDSIVRQGNGFVVGTSSHANFSNITFRNSQADKTMFGCHIKFKNNQTGNVNDVLFENLTITNPVVYAVGINQNGQEMTRGLGGNGNGNDGVRSSVLISNITFRNIRATGGLAAGYFACNPNELACQNISMENVSLLNTAGHQGCSFTNVFGQGTNVSPTSCVPPTKKLVAGANDTHCSCTYTAATKQCTSTCPRTKCVPSSCRKAKHMDPAPDHPACTLTIEASHNTRFHVWNNGSTTILASTMVLHTSTAIQSRLRLLDTTVRSTSGTSCAITKTYTTGMKTVETYTTNDQGVAWTFSSSSAPSTASNTRIPMDIVTTTDVVEWPSNDMSWWMALTSPSDNRSTMHEGATSPFGPTSTVTNGTQGLFYNYGGYKFALNQTDGLPIVSVGSDQSGGGPDSGANNGYVLPLLTFLKRGDVGLSFFETPNSLTTYADIHIDLVQPHNRARFTWTRRLLGMSPGGRVTYVDGRYVSHEDCWRPALGLFWAHDHPLPIADLSATEGAATYAYYFDQPNFQPASYYNTMDLTMNWDASFPWVYHGPWVPFENDRQYFPMGHQDLNDGVTAPTTTEFTWLNCDPAGHGGHAIHSLHPDWPTCMSQNYTLLNQWYQHLQDRFNVSTLMYGTVVEYGMGINVQHNATTAETEAIVCSTTQNYTQQLVCGANRLFQDHFSTAPLIDPRTNSTVQAAWNSVIVDFFDGDMHTSYSAFLYNNTQRLIQYFNTTIAGLCLDRGDYIGLMNVNGDDQITTTPTGRLGRALVVSWKLLMAEIHDVLHANGKALYVNPDMGHRVDMYRYVDGFYSELGDTAPGKWRTGTAWLASGGKHAAIWCHGQGDPETNCAALMTNGTDAARDHFLQSHLLLGVYPTV